jgi:hypothetical protein
MSRPSIHFALGASVATAAAAAALVVGAGDGRSGSLPAQRMSERILFDDFGHRDVDQLVRHGWSVRTRAGGPGSPDARWSHANVTLVADPARPGNRVLRLTASTDGTAAGTSQAEVATTTRKFREGTYAARIRFSDRPFTGPEGDRVVQTFFGIGPPLARSLDPAYSELDFEYLPNGGWGTTGATLFVTSWETYQEEPRLERMANTLLRASHSGWHTLVIHVLAGEVRYFVDGRPVAAHGGSSYPEREMAVSFNLWFQREGLVRSREPRTYAQDVDWVFHQAGVVLGPSRVDARVASLRRSSILFRDGV